YNLSISAIKTTSHDSGAFEESIPGRVSGTVDAPCLYDEADVGQDAALTAVTSQTVVKIRFRPKGTTVGFKQFVSDAWVAASPIAGANDNAADLKLSFNLTGTITRSTQ